MRRRSTVRWILAALGAVALAPAWAPLVGLAPRPLPPAGRLVRVGGHRVNVLDEGRGLPVVLVHGLPGSAYDWSPFSQRLLDAGFRVIRYDRVGYGHSDRRARDAAHTLDANAAELLDLLTAVGAESPLLVGWSYGGGVALMAARQDRSAIGGVVLVGSIGPTTTKDWPLPDFVEWPRRWAVSAGFPARTAAALFGRRVFNGAPPAGWADHAVSLLAAPGVIHSWMMEANQMDVTSLHPHDVDVPTTIVQGDADVLSPMDVATTLHRAIPSSSLVAVSGGTHMLPNTHADLLVNQVRMLASRIRAADPHAQQAVGQ